eukprot:TRINITY_DN3414_c0_g1_i1.p1 TRINITY_DN3414_c0_g1~~TRINITY_DN3414_c0_g1_i1.p1  ORF type:complete len:762 (+),score=180.62 TRINITY_DN3414_c0_g1_i1:87-2372(+)
MAAVQVSVVLLVGALCSAAIVLDDSLQALVFDGIGALSAGASSRLLIDYVEPQRSQILDYLFTPNFGANLHIIKVEIGGDCQSTDGTEPSHMHYRDDLSCTRGYESWLMQEARKRNPDIITWGLSWGVPQWIGNGSYFSEDNINYQVQWVKCMASLGISIDLIGIWNERSWGSVDYVLSLRAALDAAGFADTHISLPDGGIDAGLTQALLTNDTFRAAVYSAGMHYPCNVKNPALAAAGVRLWASEDYSQSPTWAGASSWGRYFVNNYLTMNITSTTAWSLIWSVFDGLPYGQAGLMIATEPWSGSYNVTAPIWTSAQFCQFTSPGWIFLGGQGSGTLPLGGGYVTLVPGPNQRGKRGTVGDFTLVIQTLEGGGCDQATPSPQNVTFSLAGHLASASLLYVWSTTEADWFVQQPSITPIGGQFTFFVDAGAMYTMTTLDIGRRGQYPPPPPSQPFPMPYTDDFQSYSQDTTPQFFSDQGGTFAVRTVPGTKNNALSQLVFDAGDSNSWVANPDPVTLIGGASYADYSVGVSVMLPGRNRPPSTRGGLATVVACDATQANQRWVWNTPAAGYIQSVSDQLCLNSLGCTSSIGFWDCVTTGGTCCGSDCYAGLQFRLDAASGQLVSALDTDQNCVTAQPHGPLVLAACNQSAAQRWVYNQTSQQLYTTYSGSAQCLTNGDQPPEVYAKACVRVSQFNGQVQSSWDNGVCLHVSSLGAWSLRSGPTTVGNGTISVDWSTWHRLYVTATGQQFTASFDGQVLKRA